MVFDDADDTATHSFWAYLLTELIERQRQRQVSEVTVNIVP